ncbi:MAG: site-specific DNA-methyltransferase [Lachnospiraceae bacterium]|nr:site-specific DNA-methyltransferase [Lachnospiraceae bacterium]
MRIFKHYKENRDYTLFEGDCYRLLREIPAESVSLILTSPPYCMKKTYENASDDIATFKTQHKRVFSEIYRVLRPGGSICWQVGYHVAKDVAIPLDYIVYDIFTDLSQKEKEQLKLRNRIVWTFEHGLNSVHRFSGRHETILWFTKGDNYYFDLDSVRVPQKYPGKRFYKGPNKGKLSGNPLGKNPSDIWAIPNVKAKHIEKTEHPCQFPVAIPQRLIKALCEPNGLVVDPYMGVCSTGVAAALERRRFAGAEIVSEYYRISETRMKEAIAGTVRIREDKPVTPPNPNSLVAKLPDEFRRKRENHA